MERVLAAAAFTFALTGAVAAETLTVYTTDSFVQEWGPGGAARRARRKWMRAPVTVECVRSVPGPRVPRAARARGRG